MQKLRHCYPMYNVRTPGGTDHFSTKKTLTNIERRNVHML